MTWRAHLESTGRANSQYCEICGADAGPASTLRRVGPTSCAACGVHACRRCWARSAGGCPGCGPAFGRVIKPAISSGARAGPAEPRADRAGIAGRQPTRPRARPRRARRPPAVAAGIALLVTSIGIALAGPLGPGGGVEGLIGTPGRSAAAIGAAPMPTGRPAPSRQRTAVSVEVATSTPGATQRPPAVATPVVTGTPTLPQPSEATSAPTPGASTAPTTAPTSAPPSSSPPTAAPTPSRCTAVAPDLVGGRRSDAAGEWRAAGFTGGVTILAGHGNYRIGTQVPPAGATLDCDSSATVGP